MPDGPGGFAQDFSCPALLRITVGRLTLRVRDYHPLWRNFPIPSARAYRTMSRSYYPETALPQLRFGLFPGRSPLLGESLLFSLPPGTKMFQFPGFASPNHKGMPDLLSGGFSHSEIRGSRVICTSPRLIAAYHVLHRLREPRHPPCALTCFSSDLTNQQPMAVEWRFIPSYFNGSTYTLYIYNINDMCCRRCLFSFLLYCLVYQYVKERCSLSPFAPNFFRR